MPSWKPLPRREFIRRLKSLGFIGPEQGSRHDFMIFAEHRQTIPSNKEYSVPQVKMLLRQVESIIRQKVSLLEWENL